MSSEWLRLGDHCIKIGSGATPTGGKDAYLESGPFTLIRSQNVYNDGFKPAGLAFINADQAKKLDGVAVQTGDVLLNITGDSVARVCLAQSQYLPARVNQHVAIIRPNADVFDSRFLRYFLASPYQQDLMLGLAAAGATRNALTKVMIEDFRVPCPPISEQRASADVLSALDDRITLLRETNATLEAIAQALFKSWFVDFDPVRAKMEGRMPEGMDEATAALFPDALVESQLGLVPEGWRWGALSDLATFQNGYAFKSRDWADSGHPVVKIGDVKPGIIDLNGCSYVAHETVIGLDRFQLSRGDLLVGMTGYVGETGLVSTVEPAAYLNQRVGRIATKSGLADLGYTYCAARSPAFKEYAEAQSHGSAQANVSGASLMAFPAVIADLPLIGLFNSIVGRTLESILANHEQAQTLATLRDTLLPRLISGQLPLPQAEVMAQEMVV